MNNTFKMRGCRPANSTLPAAQLPSLVLQRVPCLTFDGKPVILLSNDEGSNAAFDGLNPRDMPFSNPAFHLARELPAFTSQVSKSRPGAPIHLGVV
jgi:hypothetical protein